MSERCERAVETSGAPDAEVEARVYDVFSYESLKGLLGAAGLAALLAAYMSGALGPALAWRDAPDVYNFSAALIALLATIGGATLLRAPLRLRLDRDGVRIDRLMGARHWPWSSLGEFSVEAVERRHRRFPVFSHHSHYRLFALTDLDHDAIEMTRSGHSRYFASARVFEVALLRGARGYTEEEAEQAAADANALRARFGSPGLDVGSAEEALRRMDVLHRRREKAEIAKRWAALAAVVASILELVRRVVD